MVKRDFDTWIAGFRKSIADYHYYINFSKVIENANALRIELNILNSIIGSKAIRKDFIGLASKYPEVLKCIPILLAVRAKEISATDSEGTVVYRFDRVNRSVEQYADLMEKTGLFNLISNHMVNNFYDYVLGVETGLDSNGRKNRGGHLMENLVGHFIEDSGFIYQSEMYSSEIEQKYGLDLSNLTDNGKASKRFDFVVEGKNNIFGIEVNFYTGGGSKLNETARSYKMLAEEAETIPGFKFVWITDG